MSDKTPRIGGGPTRCPYCHENVDLRYTPWVACAGCLARHHADCWLSHGGCATCQQPRPLFPASTLAPARRRLRRGTPQPRRRSRGLTLGALLLTAQVGVTVLGVALLSEVAPGEVAAFFGQEPEEVVPDEVAVEAAIAQRVDAVLGEAGMDELTADLRDLRDAAVRQRVRREEAWARAALQSRCQGLESELEEEKTRRRTAEQQVERLTHLTTSLEQDLSVLRAEHAATRAKLREKELLISMAESSGVKLECAHCRGSCGHGHWHHGDWRNACALHGCRMIHGPPFPAIDGQVVAAKDGKFVLLSVGADDKVELGFRFSVYRGSTFVGKLVVERLLRDSAGCRVLFTADDQTIRAGDLVATRLQ